jgi:hypothetical protein
MHEIIPSPTYVVDGIAHRMKDHAPGRDGVNEGFHGWVR